ncbi:hypothetical protein TREMEDRAFT_65372 [Tremella mesenterica DSM 1558]|uniref:uncharacterized protein n=1 Tax=Tremella mesenterica (strain ATCC 24925 / CBS 8224 / DSM 1558 / NBRC 9311 / NRRL Y-6157 / RJB 2259-6 / UBC 559-6) TaxID=578456 RepID=UPI00032C2AB1|nr:uncharacterized protein TREMEDRAFT_65372 [Tremella mesenterica DSM 1558]EIW66505.1 hypothetical protein TREMEDRAFT_65372 [Tremella mesenterica DSM 1558]
MPETNHAGVPDVHINTMIYKPSGTVLADLVHEKAQFDPGCDSKDNCKSNTGIPNMRQIDSDPTIPCPPGWHQFQITLHNLNNATESSAIEEATAVMKKFDGRIKILGTNREVVKKVESKWFIIEGGSTTLTKGFQRSVRIYPNPSEIVNGNVDSTVMSALQKALDIHPGKPSRWSSCRGNDRITVMHFNLYPARSSSPPRSHTPLTVRTATEAVLSTYKKLQYDLRKPWAVTVNGDVARGFVANYNPNQVDHLVSLTDLGWDSGGRLYHLRFCRDSRLLLPTSGTTIATYIADDDRHPNAFSIETRRLCEEYNRLNDKKDFVKNCRPSDDDCWFLCDPATPELALWLQSQQLSSGFFFSYVYGLNSNPSNFDRRKILATRQEKIATLNATRTRSFPNHCSRVSLHSHPRINA